MLKRTLLFVSLFSSFALANPITIEVNAVNENGIGESLGTITISENKYGLVFQPDLKGLTPGAHGFHIHENPDCGETDKGPATKAGGHYDPTKTAKHGFPWDDEGHLGDLPALYVAADQSATIPVLAPKIKKLDEIKTRSIMIHTGADNYSDTPVALGGGGARMACGVIK